MHSINMYIPDCYDFCISGYPPCSPEFCYGKDTLTRCSMYALPHSYLATTQLTQPAHTKHTPQAQIQHT